MDHQRPEPQFIPARPKRLRVHVWNSRRHALPHPWASREDLQRVAAKLLSRFERVQIASRDGGMNADAHTPIHPRWRLRFSLRFGALLVFGIEFSRLQDGLFRHA